MRLGNFSFMGIGIQMLMLIVGTVCQSTVVGEETRIDFNRDIRPILSENCFDCHGQDPMKREADLRLDLRDAAVEADAIDPQDPSASELIKRIHSDDPEVIMPPPKSNRKLSADQKSLLERWIMEGAVYQPHWAFVAPKRPAEPSVRVQDWVRNPIDRFVLATLDAHTLTPSPEADRVTLIKQLSIDLTGLPPTPNEVDAFLSDKAPKAYDKLVDRLLASEPLAALLQTDGARAAEAATAPSRGTPGLRGLPHHQPKAKRVVVFWQGGGPSHVDLFDDKPTLRKMAGKDIPDSVRGTTRLPTGSAGYSKWPCIPAIKLHKTYAKAGIAMSEMLPHTGRIADDLCLVKSLHTEAVNHAPGVTFFLTGVQVPGRPSMGAWLSYGLGSETKNLPTFVVMTSSDKGKSCGQLFYDYYWGNGFLPSRFQGVRFQNTGAAVPYLANPPGVSSAARRALLDDIAALNAAHLADYGDTEIDTRIAQYETAFRMQSSVPDLIDFSKESKSTLARYGPDALNKGTYANNCLIARRLLERGVRFVQLMHSGWDQHEDLFSQLEKQCTDTDAPSAALVVDLQDRGMLDDTLVIWGGEFGRTPFGQATNGRDHFGNAFSWWLAGGGVKPGTVYGATDEFGWNITENPVHVHDMQATILHLAGVDHTRLTFRYQGGQYRLTDVHGHVVKGILA